MSFGRVGRWSSSQKITAIWHATLFCQCHSACSFGGALILSGKSGKTKKRKEVDCLTYFLPTLYVLLQWLLIAEHPEFIMKRAGWPFRLFEDWNYWLINCSIAEVIAGDWKQVQLQGGRVQAYHHCKSAESVPLYVDRCGLSLGDGYLKLRNW